MFGANQNNPNNDIMVNGSPGDSISAIKWSPQNDIFAVTAWDGTVGLYNTGPQKQTKVNAPLLCVDWRPDGKQIAMGACDNNSYLWDIQSGQQKQFAPHQASVKCLKFANQNIVITGSWDKTVKYWDLNKSATQPAGTINLPERVYCMDYLNNALVVGCADKKIRVYDVRNPGTCQKEFTTTLKHQFRCVTIFPDSSGVAVGSIEGRVMIHTFNNSSKTFAYKCHRDDNNIYSIHAIKFHKIIGTFFTAGSDGAIIFWDKDNKQKLKTLNKCSLPIVAADFSKDCSAIAYGISYDWSKGQAGYQNTKGSQLYVHKVSQDEVQRKK